MKKTSIKKEQARMFKNPVLEYFTKSSLFESTLTSIGIAMVCIWIGNKLNPEMSLNWSIGVFIAGLLFWSPFEYLLHRYLFHIYDGLLRIFDVTLFHSLFSCPQLAQTVVASSSHSSSFAQR